MQPHLKKCFEGVRSVEFGEGNVIQAMISGEKERVACAAHVDPRGKNVEVRRAGASLHVALAIAAPSRRRFGCPSSKSR